MVTTKFVRLDGGIADIEPGFIGESTGDSSRTVTATCGGVLQSATVAEVDQSPVVVVA